MKKKNLFFVSALCAYTFFSLVGCSDDDEPKVPSLPEQASLNGVYVLNSGKKGNNNSSLSFYDFETKQVEAGLFKKVNGRGLGDTANDMLVYGSKMYIAVYGSNTIEVTDLQGKSLKQITSDGDPLLPRYFTCYNGKVYVSLFDGYVASLDTTSLSIEKKVQVGRNPEQLAIVGNKMYVANSGGLDYNTEVGYDKTVSVIDIPTFKEKDKIEVVTNPVNLLADSQGDVYLISMGNYGDIPNTFQKIDSKTDAVATITETNATEFAAVGDKLYMIYSQYDANWNQTISYICYDAINEKVVTSNFITDGTEIAKPYKMGADTPSNYIFVTKSDYKTNGDVYTFNPAGQLQFKFEVGLNPVKVISAGNK